MNDVAVRLLFADGGGYHHEVVRIPREVADKHERLIDCFLEDETLARTMYVDSERLCAAYLVTEPA